MPEPLTREKREEKRNLVRWLMDRSHAQDAEIARQAQEIGKLREALKEVTNDLADEINGRLHHGQMRPDERRRYERDMEPVDKARRLLGGHHG